MEKLNVAYVYRHTLKLGEGKFWKVLGINLALVLLYVGFGLMVAALGGWLGYVLGFIVHAAVLNFVLLGVYWVYQDVIGGEKPCFKVLLEPFQNYRKHFILLSIVQSVLAVVAIPLVIIDWNEIFNFFILRIVHFLPIFDTTLLIHIASIAYLGVFLHVALRFALVPYVIRENAALGVIATLKESNRLMHKKTWQLFKLYWYILWPLFATLASTLVIFFSAFAWALSFLIMAALVVMVAYCSVVTALALPTFYQEVKLYDRQEVVEQECVPSPEGELQSA